jgi:hypothetical protein
MTTSQRRRMAAGGHCGRDAEIADLDKLAAEIDSTGYEARLVAPPGRKPRLQVASRAAAARAEDVYAEAGCYWWPWADRIAPVTDAPGAAQAIMRILRSAELPAAP